jgi:preprotein translocase subunit SecY
MGYKFYFGGTSLLILVGVAMDTVAQIEAQLSCATTKASSARQPPARAQNLKSRVGC